MTLRLGILGAAAIGPTAVIEPARDIPEVEVVAVAARDPQRAQSYAAEHQIPRVLPTYQDLIEDPSVDVVYVAGPAALHGYWSLRAIQAGKHVLSEKPFTANAEEAQEIAEAGRRRGVQVIEAMHSIYHPLWHRTAQAIRSGEIGDVKEASAVFNVGIDDLEDIRWNPLLGGGALMDLGVYPLTLLRFLFPTLELVSATATAENGVDSSFEGRYQTPTGATVGLFTKMDPGTPEEQLLVVRGSEGTLTLEMFVHPQRGGKLIVNGRNGREETTAQGDSSYSRMLKAVYRAIEDGTPALSDSSSAVATMRAIDELYRAAGMEPRQPLPVADRDR